MPRPLKYSKEKIIRQCKRCSKEFSPHIRDVNRGNGLFCSRECSNQGRRHPKTAPRTKLTCTTCKEPFERLTSNLYKSKSGYHFCSRKCKEKAQCIGGLKEIQPHHYRNGEFTYRTKAKKHHGKKCIRCGYDEYPGILRVHHIDRNRQNNDISNLLVLCPNCHEVDHLLAKDGVYTPMKRIKIGGRGGL